MPKIHATNQPDRLLDVDDREYADLRAQGLVLDVVDEVEPAPGRAAAPTAKPIKTGQE